MGAAGVGKSYVAGRVCEELARIGVPVFWPRLTDIDLSSPSNVPAAAVAVPLALSLKPRDLSAYVDSLKRVAKYRLVTSADNGPGIYLCDEGIFHKMRALHRNSRSLGMSAIADLVLQHLAAPDVVIVLEATPETVHARRSERGRADDAFDEASVRADVRLLEESIRTIEHVRRSRPSLAVLRVCVDGDGADAVVEQITAYLVERYLN